MMRRRFAALCGLLFVVMAVRTWQDATEGDIFVHTAVVRELAVRTWQPRHPVLSSDAPHAFFSPYALATALLTRASGMGAGEVLRAVGLLNLLILLLGIRRIAVAIDAERGETVAFYGLLFTLLWWGSDAWFFSGFLHLPVLAAVLPYPSTFAIGVGLLVAATVPTGALAIGVRGLVLAIVLLTHPIAFVLSVVVLTALAVRPAFAARRFIAIGVALGLAVGLSALWPYYPFLRLFTTDIAVFVPNNGLMYDEAIARIWPALSGLPALVVLWSSERRHPLITGFILFTMIYFAGAATGANFLGRLVVGQVLCLHFALASVIARLEGSSRRPVIVMAAALIATVAVSYSSALRPQISELRAGRRPPDPISVLAAYVGPDDVVIADGENSIRMPAFAGKVIAAHVPMAFVPDLAERVTAVDRFFADATTDHDRTAILAAFNVQWIVVEPDSVERWALLPGVSLTYRGPQQALLAVEPAAGNR